MKTIVCFGDSNTHGYNAENFGRFPKNVRWTGLLQNILGDEYAVKEEGMSGRTCVFDDPLFYGLNGYEYIEVALLTHEPVDKLIIMLGTNDVKERFSCNAVNIAKGLERLITRAKNRTDAWTNGKPDILVICPPPIEAGYVNSYCAEEMGKDCDAKSRKLAPLYEEVATRLGCDFMDAGSIEGMKMNTIDYMHLDEAGHRLLADAIAKQIIH